MATYRRRKNKDGSWSITATVRRRGVVGSIAETFRGDSKGSMTAAKEWAAATEAQIYFKRTKDKRSGDVPISAIFDLYFEMTERMGTKSPKTLDNERHSAKVIMRILGENILMSDITPAVVSRYRDRRLDIGIGSSKICSEFALISSIFKFAINDRGCFLDNPCAGGRVQRPKKTIGPLVFLSPEEIDRLLDECKASKNKMLAPLVLTMIHTGMRIGEAVKLKVKHFDVINKTITLTETKTDKDRIVPLTDQAYATLAELAIGKPPSAPFFYVGDLTGPQKMSPSSLFRDAFDAAKERAGLSHITQHTLRHTAASHLAMARVDLRTIADILGHSTIQMTMRYAHVSPEHRREAIMALSNLGQGQPK